MGAHFLKSLSNQTFIRTNQTADAEKALATHSSTLAWKLPWTREPGRLQSKGLLRVRHNCATSLSLFTFMHWRRKWQPTPVFLPGEFQGWRGLVGCHLWGHTESYTTGVTQQQQQQQTADDQELFLIIVIFRCENGIVFIYVFILQT